MATEILTQMPLFGTPLSKLPLPLVVASQWDFPLCHYAPINTQPSYTYAVQDWIAGVKNVTTRAASFIWAQMLATGAVNFDTWHYPYRATDDKVYKRFFTREAGLLSILSYLRPTSRAPRVGEIRNFLADTYPEYAYFRCSQRSIVRILESDIQRQVVKRADEKFNTVAEYQILPSKRIIDILTETANSYTIIECKTDFGSRGSFYQAIGQLLSYKSEFEAAGMGLVNGLILASSDELTTLNRQIVDNLAIEHWHIDMTSNG
jgi:hypothetical protein